MRTQSKFMWWLSSLFFSLAPILAQSAEPVARIGEGTHLYLRCNTTSWDVSEVNRLKTGAQNFLRELTFEVKETWMTQGGDDCVLTETPERNAWGAWQNYYGAHLPTLRVPDSAWLRVQADSAENMVFRVRFPALGRYRFVLNTRDGYFSFHRTTPPKAGEVTWTLPGNLMSDAQGQLFLSSPYPQNSLSLVDGNSGLLLWTYQAATAFSVHGNCSTQNTAFITQQGRVVAVSKQTGREIWSTDLNGDLQGEHGYLTCYPSQGQMYLSYGAERTTIVSLAPTTGKVLWAWVAPASAGVLGIDGRQVFISGQQDAKAMFVVLSLVEGRELWKANPGTGYFSLAPDGSLFLVDGAWLTAMEPATGRALWTYAAQQNEPISLSFEQNGLYVHERTRISSIDKRNGRIVWAHDYQALAAQNPHAQILKTGVVLVQALDHAARVSRQIALNCWTGHVLWEREETGTGSFVSEVNQQETWLINGKTIQAIAPWTGVVRWRFVLNSAAPSEGIMNVLEQDKNTVYVAYGLAGSQYPPMGVLALDRKTGALNWQSWLDASLSRVAGDAHTLILNAGHHGSTKALKK
ncbi:outer membrane protein assembly factor BamB family protein [Oligoflexus tunisiensis]|uniref:outer membrane protein assembly factor BamB family protein n=1 Tax=Oligoflexus tunisiensis TaxID=708132 RepID=UPI00114CECCB|nr:PQQ-binding-like beta-propeller repeat protein [Oligoflexus tunisiensis]